MKRYDLDPEACDGESGRCHARIVERPGGGFLSVEDLPETIEVIRPSSTVLIGGDIEAIVLDYSIRAHQVQYHVAWWDGRGRHEEWLDRTEVVPAGVPEELMTTVRVGFR